MELDHPKIRRDTTCPLCDGAKDVGLVACWSCYRRTLKYGNAHAARLLDIREQLLELQAVA